MIKTYCWKCKKEVVMLNPIKSINNKKLVIGYCYKCGTQIYKTYQRLRNGI